MAFLGEPFVMALNRSVSCSIDLVEFGDMAGSDF